jgi:adenylosuccinate lyase
LEEVERRIAGLKFRGVKGTTGTQASFLSLFQGDHEKVLRLDRLVAEKMGFAHVHPVTGQTYTRKVDSQVLDALGGIAQSAHKAATDWRLLQSWREIEEPLAADQVGSSAMAYKRNPMRAERICGLARFLTSLQGNTAATAETQWMERTLDDSANRRLVIPQAFLAADAILILYESVATGFVVNEHVIAARLAAELPFMATEEILMAAVAAGGDRQDLHERIRRHSLAAAEDVKQLGQENDLLERLAADPAFSKIDLKLMTEPKRFIGRSPQIVDEFLSQVIAPIREKYKHLPRTKTDVTL